jgi:hypothetical protein
MIRGMHAIIYTPHAAELRAFIRDKLGFPHADVGDGWLIFDVPQADLACHPSERVYHELSFYCDDIHATVAQLKERGVEFSSGISDAGWGLTTMFRAPGDIELMLYQPKYEKQAGA